MFFSFGVICSPQGFFWKGGYYCILKNTFGVFCRQSLKITLLCIGFLGWQMMMAKLLVLFIGKMCLVCIAVMYCFIQSLGQVKGPWTRAGFTETRGHHHPWLSPLGSLISVNPPVLGLYVFFSSLICFLFFISPSGYDHERKAHPTSWYWKSTPIKKSILICFLST